MPKTPKPLSPLAEHLTLPSSLGLEEPPRVTGTGGDPRLINVRERVALLNLPPSAMHGYVMLQVGTTSNTLVKYLHHAPWSISRGILVSMEPMSF